jgi:hypothetical protein
METNRKRNYWRGLLVGLSLAAAFGDNPAMSADAGNPNAKQKDQPSLNAKSGTVYGLLPTDRIVIGTVEEIRSDQIRVDIGDIEPRYLPLAVAKEKDMPKIKKGDKLVIIVNDQNLVVDYHPFCEPGHLHIIRGALTTPLVIGQEKALIRTREGKEASFEIRPLARSRIAGLPVGSPALFLLDESNKIVDAFFGSDEALARSEREYETTQWRGSPAKGAHTRLPVTVIKAEKDRLTGKTDDGTERHFQVLPTAREKMSSIREGQKIILLIDQENKIVDIAVPPDNKG